MIAIMGYSFNLFGVTIAILSALFLMSDFSWWERELNWGGTKTMFHRHYSWR